MNKPVAAVRYIAAGIRDIFEVSIPYPTLGNLRIWLKRRREARAR